MLSKTAILVKNELRNYFHSASAYVVLVVFLLITGWFFASPLFIVGQAELRSLFGTIPWIFLLFIPAITMGSIAKEKTAGTLETLTTLPLKESQIIMGKYWAALLLTLVGVVFTLVHFVTIVMLGSNIDYGAIFCGYLGLILIGAVYSSIGIFASTLTNNQIVAFIVSFLFIFFFVIIEFILIFLPGSLVEIFQYLSIGYHFSNISRGVIDSRNIIYFLSLIVFFLRLAVISMETRKWK
ncbi:MAG: ABC transporter permease [Candidatus Cloacimonetes bacterium]|nr:ABC transporter permease [Candidatus Cloacimonadota bacterium]